MIRNESINGHDDRGDGLLELTRVSTLDAENAWDQFTKNHIPPAELFRLATRQSSPTESARRHLEFCDSCRKAFDAYGSAGVAAAEKRDDPPNSHSRPIAGNPVSKVVAANGNGLAMTPANAVPEQVGPSSVPSLLCQHLRVEGPVQFPGGEVALESWQFGRIHHIAGTNPELAEHIVDIIAENLMQVMLPRLAHDNLMLVCFGRAMHRCGTRWAAKLADCGFEKSHVVLAHDYYSPTLVCDPTEFKNSDVIVLVDVVHSGTTLDNLMSMCRDRNPRRVRGLALIDQSANRSLGCEWYSVWSADREDRMTLDEYLQDPDQSGVEALLRYEANEECAVTQNRDDRNRRDSHLPDDPKSVIDLELLKHIHATGALKQDHLIGEKRYPYVVNVLDLLKDGEARKFVLDRAEQELMDLSSRRVCLAYHAERAARAGEIAKLLNGRFGWPMVSIGTKGPTFSVTHQQFCRVACYDTILLVDAAIRTGDSLAAMAKALDDTWLKQHSRVMAVCVLDALSGKSRLELSEALELEIRTLFNLPLAPPTEQVRHWANRQKAIIREQMLNSGTFTRVQHILESYCQTSHRFHIEADKSLEQTQTMLETAVSERRTPQNAAMNLDVACTEGKPRIIRHLAIDDIVHDRAIQNMLLGVMFNSMKPSFKESAAFALAAAQNYDWMTIDWLKCNRPFLAAECDAWKSILMVECNMKLTNRTRELTRFREAAVEYREKCIPEQEPEDRRSHFQMTLPGVGDLDKYSVEDESRTAASRNRLRERLGLVIEVAG